MNKWPCRPAILGAALVLSLMSCSPMPSPARGELQALRLMTFNIRFDNPADGANAWPLRKEMAAGVISFNRVDIAGLQEALSLQIEDLRELLPEYDWVGVGRDDGREAGEFCPIFFRKDRFRLLGSSTFWLSEEPAVPGVLGWDAACPRIVTWARFRDLWTGHNLWVFNTHFDHVGELARRESSALVLTAMRTMAGREAVALIGDFNFTRESPAYQALVDDEEGRIFLRDARDISDRPPFGPASSFNGFRTEVRDGLPIDHIFVGPGISVPRAGILPGYWDGRFVSDHNPVLAEIRLAKR